MTKLKGPRQQEALLQIPPSQKEMQGAEGTLHFHARPRANSKQSFVAFEPANVLR